MIQLKVFEPELLSNFFPHAGFQFFHIFRMFNCRDLGPHLIFFFTRTIIRKALLILKFCLSKLFFSQISTFLNSFDALRKLFFISYISLAFWYLLSHLSVWLFSTLLYRFKAMISNLVSNSTLQLSDGHLSKKWPWFEQFTFQFFALEKMAFPGSCLKWKNFVFLYRVFHSQSYPFSTIFTAFRCSHAFKIKSQMPVFFQKNNFLAVVAVVECLFLASAVFYFCSSSIFSLLKISLFIRIFNRFHCNVNGDAFNCNFLIDNIFATEYSLIFISE